jgi:hypothetical protein
VQDWRLADLDGAAVLLLPRRWLILSRQLSPLAALMLELRFRLGPRLLNEFWLELPDPSGLGQDPC